MTDRIQKNFVYNKTISSETDDPIRRYFKDFIGSPDRPRGLLEYIIQIPNISSNPTDLEIANKNEINSVINEASGNLEKTFIYHNFSYLTPSNNLNDAYYYSIKEKINDNLITKYEHSLESENIAIEQKIKNIYLIEQDGVEKYYNSNLLPLREEDWTNFDNFYIPMKNISNVVKNIEIEKQTPLFVHMNIPAVKGLLYSKEPKNTDLFDLFSFKNSANTDNYFSLLLNLINAKKQQIDIVFNDTLFRAYPLLGRDALLKAVDNFDNNLARQKQLKSLLDVKNSVLIDPAVIIENIDNYKDKQDQYSIIRRRQETPAIPLFYKILKKRKGVRGEIQTFYVPYDNSGEFDIYDNQIFSFNEYEYEIKIIVLSIGVAYKYQMEKTDTYAKFLVKPANLETNIAFFELPFFTAVPNKTKNLPVIPDVNIIGLINEPNNIKIFLNTKPGVEKPIFFNDEERMLLNYDQDSSLDINFISNIFTNFFVYRTDVAPTSYSSFANSKISFVTKDKKSFLDTLEINKKYYYTFRTSNGRYFSNPSEIYEVELKNDEGVTFYSIKPYTIKPIKIARETQLSLKQRISVKPSYLQTNLKINNTDLKTYEKLRIQDVFFDLSNLYGVQSIFSGETDVKYKIRVRSKQTGKMVDINLNFAYDFKNLIKK